MGEEVEAEGDEQEDEQEVEQARGGEGKSQEDQDGSGHAQKSTPNLKKSGSSSSRYLRTTARRRCPGEGGQWKHGRKAVPHCQAELPILLQSESSAVEQYRLWCPWPMIL